MNDNEKQLFRKALDIHRPSLPADFTAGVMKQIARERECRERATERWMFAGVAALLLLLSAAAILFVPYPVFDDAAFAFQEIWSSLQSAFDFKLQIPAGLATLAALLLLYAVIASRISAWIARKAGC